MFDINKTIRQLHIKNDKLAQNKRVFGEFVDVFDEVLPKYLNQLNKKLAGLIRYVDIVQKRNSANAGVTTFIVVYPDEDQLTPSILNYLDRKGLGVNKQIKALMLALNSDLDIKRNFVGPILNVWDGNELLASYGYYWLDKSSGIKPLWDEDKANGVNIKRRKYPKLIIEFSLYEKLRAKKSTRKIDVDTAIEQMSEICRDPAFTRNIKTLASTALKLQKQGVTQAAIEKVINQKSKVVNTQIKKLFALCNAIDDRDMATVILTFLEDVFHTYRKSLNNAIQNSFAYTGYKYPINLKELAEYTFDAWLDSHDISLFD